MKRTTAFIVLTTAVVLGTEVNSHSCGDNSWTPYKDEQCFKLFKTFLTRTQAQEHCSQQASSLVTIKSAGEQLFLNEYIFNSSDSNSIWIGAERRNGSETEFDWVDGSPVTRFTNWRVGSPSNVIGRACVQMQTKYSRQLSDLEWIDTGCNGAASWFICQKLQTWSIEDLQRAILITRKEMENSVEDLTALISGMTDEMNNNVSALRNELRIETTSVRNEMRTEMTNVRTEMTTMRNTINSQLQTLQSNPVPIGFIYVQLSGQSEPRTIWPTVTWTEVTSQYAGLFFRAQGGGSAGFGSVQEAFIPRITQIDTTTLNGNLRLRVSFPDSDPWNLLTIGRWSSVNGENSNWALHFRESFGEIRPRNSAIRIWRRNQ